MNKAKKGIIVLLAVIGFSISACNEKEDNSSNTPVPSSAPAFEASLPKAIEEAPVPFDSSHLDNLLNEYSKTVDDYIAAAKKLDAGDATASEKIQELDLKMKTLAEQLLPYKDKITPEQKAKIDQQTEKMKNAFGN